MQQRSETDTVDARAAWWRSAVTYQVYIRSFADGDGDGTGDLAGLRSRLPYLRDLGVDAIWINPWYRSPLHDGGYDVADYRSIDPRYGSLADADALIAEAHALGLRVVADLVPNHTSIEHEWFVEALAAVPGDPARSRYVFRPGRGADGAEPPTNWRAVFGGSAWERSDGGEWYLHLFDVSQPDLDWSHPEVRSEFLDIFRFWFDRGIDGFRVDVAHALTKDSAFPDVDPDVPPFALTEDGSHPYWDRDDVHDIIREWRAVADSYDDDKVLVAEAWVSPERLSMYLEPDQYHQSFNFDFLLAPWAAPERREVIERAIEVYRETGSLPTWVLSNHDVVRHATRFAQSNTEAEVGLAIGDSSAELDADAGLRRARAAALLMLALPGSVYLYQGEELGLPEVTDLPDEVLDDPIWERSGHTLRGRDGCRVPIPWRPDGPSFGFGDAAPWLPQPAWFGAMSVGAQSGVAGSTLELYRAALAIRRERLALAAIDTTWGLTPGGGGVIEFERGSVVCVTNFGPDEVPCPKGLVLLSSAPLGEGGVVPVDVSVWVDTSRPLE